MECIGFPGKHFLLCLAAGAHTVRQNKEKVLAYATLALQSQLSDFKSSLHSEEKLSQKNQASAWREDAARNLGVGGGHTGKKSLSCSGEQFQEWVKKESPGDHDVPIPTVGGREEERENKVTKLWEKTT